jgi:hypothetical protein
LSILLNVAIPGQGLASALLEELLDEDEGAEQNNQEEGPWRKTPAMWFA